MKPILYIVELVIMGSFYALMRVLPLDAASWLGGRIALLVGPLTATHKLADKNLRLALPEMDAEARATTVREMWEHLGRCVGEFPHLHRNIMQQRCPIVSGQEHIANVRAKGEKTLFISAHFGQWEMAPVITAREGMKALLFYRPMSNPLTDWVVRRQRLRYAAGLAHRDMNALRSMLRAMKSGQAMALLVDQRNRHGNPVPFFGHPALTDATAATLALRYGAVILPGRVMRTRGAHFEGHFDAPIRFADGTSELEAMTRINQHVEQWIREKPSQWFWVHNRWKLAKPVVSATTIP